MTVKKIKHNLSRRVKDDKTGIKHKLRVAAELTGIPYDTVYGYVTECAAKTFSDLYHLRDNRSANSGFASIKRPTYKTKYGVLTAREILDKHRELDHESKMNLPCISSRLNAAGTGDGMFDGLWDPIRKRKGGVRTKKSTPTPVIDIPKNGEFAVLDDFDRNTFCQRSLTFCGKITLQTIKCVHYSDCANSRAFTEIHQERYKKDGSCYAKPS